MNDIGDDSRGPGRGQIRKGLVGTKELELIGVMTHSYVTCRTVISEEVLMSSYSSREAEPLKSTPD